MVWILERLTPEGNREMVRDPYGQPIWFPTKKQAVMALPNYPDAYVLPMRD